jgi:hypothetical protein
VVCGQRERFRARVAALEDAAAGAAAQLAAAQAATAASRDECAALRHSLRVAESTPASRDGEEGGGLGAQVRRRAQGGLAGCFGPRRKGPAADVEAAPASFGKPSHAAAPDGPRREGGSGGVLASRGARMLAAAYAALLHLLVLSTLYRASCPAVAAAALR